MIWARAPHVGLTIIGVLVGISFIFRGVSWLMVGFALKRLPRIGCLTAGFRRVGWDSEPDEHQADRVCRAAKNNGTECDNYEGYG